MIPEGDHVGKQVRLEKFQKDFLLDVYDNPHVTDTAILSMARKNAKTALIAFMVLAHLVGPEAVLNSHIISGAMSREQAGEVFKLARKTAELSPQLTELIAVVPSSKKLVGKPMNVEYQAISAEGKTAHGKSPIVAILDEVGQIRGPRSEFVDAVTTAQGAYLAPLLIYISTQAADDGDMLSILIDDYNDNKPKKTVCHVHCADKDADVSDEKQWRKANPALGKFRSEPDMRKQAEKAARMPSFENTFRNLNLNQRVSTVAPFVSKSIWESCGDYPEGFEELELYGGLDLSSKTDLTSLVLIGKLGDAVNVWPFFWVPEDGLLDRADRDRQPYDIWHKQGFLRTVPGKTINYAFVIKDIIDIVGNANLASIGFDRWKIDYFKKDCESLGVLLPLIEHGQGFKDMAPAIDDLEEYLLNGNLAHGNNPLLTMCASNVKTVKDPADNRKFEKSKSTGRIDGMQALAMAVGTMKKEAGDTGHCPWDDENFSICA